MRVSRGTQRDSGLATVLGPMTARTVAQSESRGSVVPGFAPGYARGATDPVSASPDDRVTKHEMNVSPWSHVAWSGA